jgi:hypothetical protein
MRTFIALLLLLPSWRPVVGQTAPVTAAACSSKAQRLLGIFVGDFNVRAAYRSGATCWDSSAVRSHFAWELGGCVLVEHFDGRCFGEPYA